jgi:hypothetical protein
MSIKDATFPNYEGRKFRVLPSSRAPKFLDSYWDEGSIRYYALYNLQTGESVSVEIRHPVFDAHKPRAVVTEYPEHIVLVEHDIIRGKDAGLTFYIHDTHLGRLLPSPKMELSEEEILVLYLIRAYMSKYRLEEAARVGISPREYEAIKDMLMSKGLIDKRGAITVEGRNFLSGFSYSTLDKILFERRKRFSRF